MEHPRRRAAAIAAAGAAVLAMAATASAQTLPPAPPAIAASATAAALPPAATSAGAARSGPPVDALTPTVTVIEDDNARIEETRLRGQPQRITVQSKVGNVRAYEILVGGGGRDPSQERGAAGRRAWSLLDF